MNSVVTPTPTNIHVNNDVVMFRVIPYPIKPNIINTDMAVER